MSSNVVTYDYSIGALTPKGTSLKVDAFTTDLYNSRTVSSRGVEIYAVSVREGRADNHHGEETL